MTPPSAHWRLPLCVLVGYVIHLTVSPRLVAFGASPHIGLTALAIACLFAGPNLASVLGFMLGLMEAWANQRYVGSYIVSRSVVGFSVGAMDQRVFRDHVLMAVAAAVVATLIANGLLFVFAPQPHYVRWIVRTVMSALYNGALGIPLYYLIRRVASPPRHL